MTVLTHDSSEDWDGLMIAAMTAAPDAFRWAFWAGRNFRCVSGPYTDMLCQMYTPHYMLHRLRAAGVFQHYSLDVNVYLLVLDALFNLRLTLFIMSRNDSGVYSLGIQMTS